MRSLITLLLPPFLLVAMPEFDNTVTAIPLYIHEMRICVVSVLSDGLSGSVKVITIAVAKPQLQCFASKPFLGVSCFHENSTISAVELLLQCAALNRMIQLCKPESYVVKR